MFLAHTDKADAFRRYARFSLAQHEEVTYSDEHQMGAYPANYHRHIDRRTGARGTEVMTELFCERIALEPFLAELRAYARQAEAGIVSASVSLVEQDRESFLAWARRPYACVTLDLHVDRGTSSLIRAGDRLRRLIDIALRYGGGYYLAYHRHAIRRQLLAAYPQFPVFVRYKRKYDPGELFQSEWYRYYRDMVER
jgi:FAD/FMN-containing dehydrogenase